MGSLPAAVLIFEKDAVHSGVQLVVEKKKKKKKARASAGSSQRRKGATGKTLPLGADVGKGKSVSIVFTVVVDVASYAKVAFRCCVFPFGQRVPASLAGETKGASRGNIPVHTRDDPLTKSRLIRARPMH